MKKHNKLFVLQRFASRHSERFRAGFIISSIMIVGAVLFIVSKAATPVASLEAENGTVSGARTLAGNGSSAGYVQFQAPSTSNAGYWDPALNRPFANNSLFNTPTPSTTQWFSQPVLNNLVPGDYYYAAGAVRRWYVHPGHPIWSAKDTDPTWTLKLVSPHDVNARRERPDITVTVNAPANLAVDTNDGDHVLLLISGGKYYEVYQAVVNQSTRTVTQSYPGYAIGDIRTDVGYSSMSSTANMGTRAGNMSWLAGMITGRDFANNKIDHAVAIALGDKTLYASCSGTRNTPKWDQSIATFWDNGPGCGPIIMGAKLGIPPGVSKPPGLSKFGNMLFDALQTYGAYVGDYAGGDWPVIYMDANSVAPADQGWEYNSWVSDNAALMPLLRVAKSATGE